MSSPYREIAETVVDEAASGETLPAVRAPLTDIPELEREIRGLLAERGLTGNYEVEVSGDVVAVIPRGGAG